MSDTMTTNAAATDKLAAQTSPLQHDIKKPLVCDVVVLGSGPAGATAARQLALAGIDVLMVEKAPFPRFTIGESFLPFNKELLQDLGLEERLQRHPHVIKRGAEFGMGNDLATTLYHFDLSLVGKGTGSFNIARAEFDQMLQTAAVEAGARLHQPATVKQMLKLTDGSVELLLASGQQVHAKYLVDASGQSSMVGKHLKLKAHAPDKHLRKVAYFAHYTGVKRLKGYNEGMLTVVMCDEGWFWIIPLDENTTSIGLVIDVDASKKIIEQGVSKDSILTWAIEHTPLMASRMKEAKGPTTNEVRGDFSYRCPPYAGEGFFLIGDAALFLDPVFSTGVCLGMYQGVQVAEYLEKILRQNASPALARKAHAKLVNHTTYWFSRLVKHYYTHSFRELFLHGRGPLELHRALIALLAGHVFPTPVWKVKWRFWLFEAALKIQKRTAMVPRRKHFSLIEVLMKKETLTSSDQAHS